MKVKFNIISITKTRFKKHTAIIIRIINKNLTGYAKEHTPTEANCGSALLYIDNSGIIVALALRQLNPIHKKKGAIKFFFKETTLKYT